MVDQPATPPDPTPPTDSDALLQVRGLKKHFPVQTGFLASLLHRGEVPAVRAVDGVDFDIRKGEVFGLAGESGSGKSTVGRLVLNLLQPTAGSVTFDGVDLSKISHEEMRKLRARMQVIFQDPLASLNPRMSIGEAISHPAEIHEPSLTNGQRRRRVLDMLDAVGMSPADSSPER